jgi:shingomyelin synthase
MKLVLEPAAHHTCGDMVFSGHSVLLLMCCMVFQEYCSPSFFARKSPQVVRASFLIRASITVATAFGLLAIVGTRLHYTLDVLTATYITVLLWDTYHYHMKSNEQGKKFDWALKILRWLEAEEVAAIDAAALSRWARRGVLKEVKS